MCNAAGAIAVTRASRTIGGVRGLAPPPARATGMTSRGQSERHRASDDAAVHDAPAFSHVVIGDRAMEQAAVVPPHEITLPPALRIDELPLRRVFEQLVEEGRSLGLEHALDVRGMV